MTFKRYERALLWAMAALAALNLACAVWQAARPAAERPKGADASTVWWAKAPVVECRHERGEWWLADGEANNNETRKGER